MNKFKVGDYVNRTYRPITEISRVIQVGVYYYILEEVTHLIGVQPVILYEEADKFYELNHSYPIKLEITQWLEDNK